MNYTNEDSWIKQTLEQCKPGVRGFGYHGDTPLGESWGIVLSVHRDSPILDESNFAVISADMLKRYPRQVTIERLNHWAVGWIDYLMIQLITKRGKPTKAAAAMFDWLSDLDDYPVANEEHYSMMESKAELQGNEESIRYADRGQYVNLPDDYIDQTLTWLYSNDQESLDNASDHDGYIEESKIRRAWFALGYYDREAYDDSEWAELESEYLTIYTLTPASNLPDKSQWFISCNRRDMDPYRCNTVLESSFWESFNTAIRNAIKYGEKSIVIEWIPD